MKETVYTLRHELVPLLGKGEADAVVSLIFHSLFGWNRVDMLIHDDQVLLPETRKRIADMLVRLKAGEPVQYVTGEAYFYGMFLKVDRSVLIPRPETAELVDMIVDRWGEKSDLSVLDLGTGSGCMAIALARNLKFPKVTALDFSAGALAVAKENARLMKASVDFVNGDMLSWRPEKESFDVIVSNPPYVCESEKREMEPTVLDWEPATALFVPDSDPLRYYKAIASIAGEGLRPGGMLYLEINPLHSDDLCDMLREKGFSDVVLSRDVHGRDRFVSCVKPENQE